MTTDRPTEIPTIPADVSKQVVLQKMAEANFCPITELVSYAKDYERVPERTRISICMELLQYIQPKLRAIEHSGSVDTKEPRLTIVIAADPENLDNGPIIDGRTSIQSIS